MKHELHVNAVVIVIEPLADLLCPHHQQFI
jgi:hypothetical protein